MSFGKERRSSLDIVGVCIECLSDHRTAFEIPSIAPFQRWQRGLRVTCQVFELLPQALLSKHVCGCPHFIAPHPSQRRQTCSKSSEAFGRGINTFFPSDAVGRHFVWSSSLQAYPQGSSALSHIQRVAERHKKKERVGIIKAMSRWPGFEYARRSPSVESVYRRPGLLRQ